MSKFLGHLSRAGAASLIALTASVGLAQSESKPAATTAAVSPPRQTTGDVRRDTLLKMQKPVTIDMNETPLEDAIKYLVEVTGADIEALWTSETEGEGLSKESKVTMSAKGMPALLFLEKMLGRIDGGAEKNAWQMDEEGVLQVGTKNRLNKYRRVEIYDVNDLLFILPVYDNAPQIDLQQVLQQAGRGGGGGGSSPFREGGANGRGGRQQQQDPPTKEQRIKDLVDNIIIKFIEPDQWVNGGGEGGTIYPHEGTLIVNAPDYMHRQLAGYKWWPSFRASANSGGRRYVQLNIDTSINQLERPIRTVPVTGVTAGGGLVRPPGGG